MKVCLVSFASPSLIPFMDTYLKILKSNNVDLDRVVLINGAEEFLAKVQNDFELFEGKIKEFANAE